MSNRSLDTAALTGFAFDSATEIATNIAARIYLSISIFYRALKVEKEFMKLEQEGHEGSRA